MPLYSVLGQWQWVMAQINLLIPTGDELKSILMTFDAKNKIQNVKG